MREGDRLVATARNVRYAYVYTLTIDGTSKGRIEASIDGLQTTVATLSCPPPGSL